MCSVTKTNDQGIFDLRSDIDFIMLGVTKEMFAKKCKAFAMHGEGEDVIGEAEKTMEEWVEELTMVVKWLQLHHLELKLKVAHKRQ